VRWRLRKSGVLSCANAGGRNSLLSYCAFSFVVSSVRPMRWPSAGARPMRACALSSR